MTTRKRVLQKDVPCSRNSGSCFSPKKARRADREEKGHRRRQATAAAAQNVMKR